MSLENASGLYRNLALSSCIVLAIAAQDVLSRRSVQAEELAAQRSYFELSGKQAFLHIWEVENDILKASVLDASDVPEDRSLELAEGYYLGFYYAPAPSGGQKLDRVMRVKVIEIEDRVRLSVGIEALKYIRPESSLRLYRPTRSTTSELQALPDMATIEFAEKAELDKLLFLARSRNDLLQIGLAMQNFHDVYGHFPPAVVYGPDGKPWHSWRVILLPYVEERALYDSYDFTQPWNGPANKRLAERAPVAFRDEIYGEADPGITHYLAITGSCTAFPIEGAKLGDDLKLNLRKTPGMTSREDLVDGPEQTLLVGPAPAEAKIPWTKPEDIQWSDKFPGPGEKGGFGLPYVFGHQRAGAFLLAPENMTGAVIFTDSVLLRSFRGLLTIAGGESIDVASFPQFGPLPRWPRKSTWSSKLAFAGKAPPLGCL